MTRIVSNSALLGIALTLGIAASPAAVAEAGPPPEPKPRVSPAARQPDGLLVHSVRSPYQAGQTQIRVLLPEQLQPDTRYPVVYLLPVEAGSGTRWGDCLAEVRKHDLHNRHRLIFVAPTFSHLPWYADHPTDPHIRQESYLLKVVLPFVEQTYPALAERQGRLLLGFSKSGWGAFSLLLRQPDTFARAAAWDAPLMEDRPKRFGMGPIFATQENFEPYRITNLLRHRAAGLRDKPARLILTGYGNFRDQHVAAHKLMVELGVPHQYRDGPARQHAWQSGWVAEAVELLTNR